MQSTSKSAAYQDEEFRAGNDSSDVRLDDPQGDQDLRPYTLPKQHYSGGLFLYSNDQYSCFSKESPLEGRDERSHKYVKQYVVKAGKFENPKESEEKASPKHTSPQENKNEADMSEETGYYQKTNFSSEIIDESGQLMLSRGSSIKGGRQQGHQYGEIFNILEESVDEKFQPNYRNARRNSNKINAELSGSESPTGRREFKNRREEHYHRKGNHQHGSHRNNQENRNTKNRQGKSDAGKTKMQGYSQIQNDNDDTPSNGNNELISTENTSTTKPNPEIQNVIWNQQQFNIMMPLQPQMRNPQQVYMQPGPNPNMFMPENPFPRVDGMYGMGFPTFPNYMMPIQQFPVMQVVPQFQDPQFQLMGKNIQGGDLTQMNMNNYGNYQKAPNDQEGDGSFKGNNQQHYNNKGHSKQNQGKTFNNRNNNRGNNESNQNDNGGANNRRKNNQNKGYNGQSGNARNNTGSENGQQENIVEMSENGANRKNDRQGGNQQNKREENRQMRNQMGGTPDLQEDELETLIEQAFTLSKDQTGCRKLQKKLETEDQTVITRIFEAILPNFVDLMIDPFGNYLCQKIVETCTSEQVGLVIKQVTSDLISMCLNAHGTRAVQKLIEICAEKDSMLKQITTALSADVVGLVKDNNGNHVIQKCLASLSAKNKQFIYDSIIQNCLEVGTHKHGCCVIQRCLDSASSEQRDSLIKVIADNTLDLVRDQYGNYVVQYVLDLKDLDERTKQEIGEHLVESAIDLSKEKFSSNVIEKCLVLRVPCFLENLIQQILQENHLVGLICDNFANYVVQRCLSLAEEDQLKLILQKIQENSEVIRNDPIGQKIFSKLTKSYIDLDEADLNPKNQSYDNQRNDENFQYASKGNYYNNNINTQQKRNRGGPNGYNNDKRNQKNPNNKKGNNENRNFNNSRGNSDGNYGQYRGNKQGMNQRQSEEFSNQNIHMGGNGIEMMNSEMPIDNSGGFYPNVGMNVQFRPNPMVGFMQPQRFMPSPGFYMPQPQMFNNGGYNQPYGYPPQGFPYKHMG